MPIARLAALAGTETRRLGGGRRGVEGHVLAQRWTRRAGRQAIDAGGFDREPEAAVEGAVAPLNGLPAGIRVGESRGGERHDGEWESWLLGHDANVGTRPNLLYPAPAGNSPTRKAL